MRPETFAAIAAAASLLLPADIRAAEPIGSRQDRFDDFDTLWNHVGAAYAYLDKKATDWNRAREIHRPRAGDAATREELIHVLEETLDELYDSHAHLDTNTPRSPRLVPSGADIWASWRDGKATIDEVRPESAAHAAGLRAGLEVVAINGVPIREAAARRLGRALRAPDAAAEDWALRAVLAGRHDEDRRLKVRDGTHEREVLLQKATPPPAARPLLEARPLGSSVGYIRVRNSLGDARLVADLDAALAEMRDKAGLLLDLRDTPSGGNTTVARAIMGRFIEEEAPYQRHELVEEERRYGVKRSWLEIVSPRGPFCFRAPVVVLVSHWTGSMGEGLAIGMDAIGRATVVGTRMAGLAGATEKLVLPHSRIGVYLPVEALFHIRGTPREDFVPQVVVDLAPQDQEDPILAAGLRTLATQMAP